MSAGPASRSNTDRIVVDPAVAFRIFTELLDSGWKRGVELGTGRRPSAATLHFEPGPGGRLVETGADGAFEVGEVRVWSPPARLVFVWRQGNYQPDQETEVEVRFEAIPSGTRVTLEHRGWDAFPDDHPGRHGHGRSAAFTAMWEDVWTGWLDGFASFAVARHPETGVTR